MKKGVMVDSGKFLKTLAGDGTAPGFCFTCSEHEVLFKWEMETDTMRIRVKITDRDKGFDQSPFPIVEEGATFPTITLDELIEKIKDM